MATSTRLLVVCPFETYEYGQRITGAAEMQRVLTNYPDFVLRERVTAESEPTKAEVKAAGLPAEAEARVAVGLPEGPIKAEDTDKSKSTRVQLKG